MTHNRTGVPATSLLWARKGYAATAACSEHYLIGQLQAAASALGCSAPELPTAIWVGLKLRQPVCLYDQASERSLALLSTVVSVLIGADSGQVLQLRYGAVGDEVSRRFAAFRTNEFVSTAVEPAQQGKAWFLLVDISSDPHTILHWLMREVRTTLRTQQTAAQNWPANLFVLGVSRQPVSTTAQCLALCVPSWDSQRFAERTVPTLGISPPVGYQRCLLKGQLRGFAYRRWLRAHAVAQAVIGGRNATDLPAKFIMRWLAASFDQQGQGLWESTDAVANMTSAIAALRRLSGKRRSGAPIC
jgi:hypothetical protein